ncbi:MAG TPA: hypothetical protein PLM32_07665, partial [Candidatus Competibacter sp.]|nr:hypothetical protein [Candidatus Competibacter sp.]
MSDPNPAIVARIADELRRARRLLFITGAGISADSGLPTYRGIGGLGNNPTNPEYLSTQNALVAAAPAATPPPPLHHPT